MKEITLYIGNSTLFLIYIIRNSCFISCSKVFADFQHRPYNDCLIRMLVFFFCSNFDHTCTTHLWQYTCRYMYDSAITAIPGSSAKTTTAASTSKTVNRTSNAIVSKDVMCCLSKTLCNSFWKHIQYTKYTLNVRSL